jgi:hypothetical protein
MKRYGYLYERIYDFDNLILAHKNARKGKRYYKEVQMVDSDPYYYLHQIYESLKNKTFTTSEYEIFEKKECEKARTIHKLPYYPDRIVQWAILQIIEPIFMKAFIYDTYSAIPGRGIHLGLKRLQKALKDRENTKYCLKIDIKKYYQSIPHNRIKEVLRRKFKDPDLMWLLSDIIDSVPGNLGIPIGNFTSQYFGNFYLSSMDHWLKEKKGVRHYFRYMDDVVILHKNKKYLHWLRKEIQWFLEKQLKLDMKNNWQVFPSFIRGIDFLGYRSFGDYTLLRKSTAKKFKERMKEIIERKPMKKNKENCVASYEGWLKWCDSYRLQEKYLIPAKEAIKHEISISSVSGKHSYFQGKERGPGHLATARCN